MYYAEIGCLAIQSNLTSSSSIELLEIIQTDFVTMQLSAASEPSSIFILFRQEDYHMSACRRKGQINMESGADEGFMRDCLYFKIHASESRLIVNL